MSDQPPASKAMEEVEELSSDIFSKPVDITKGTINNKKKQPIICINVCNFNLLQLLRWTKGCNILIYKQKQLMN